MAIKKVQLKRASVRTVGVVFPGSFKMYTYRIPAYFAPYRGQSLIVVVDGMPKVVFVVALNPPVPEGFSAATLKPIHGVVQEL